MQPTSDERLLAEYLNTASGDPQATRECAVLLNLFLRMYLHMLLLKSHLVVGLPAMVLKTESLELPGSLIIVFPSGNSLPRHSNQL